jgi:tetratricopeptide (TPR) repeat protein
LATLGPDHSETRNAWNNLAVAYQSSGRAADAIKVFERQLDRARKTLGSSHPDTLISANNLAAAYQSVGRDESALTLLEEVYRVRRETPGADHPDTLTSANNLATSYRKAGRSAEAIARFEDVLARRRSRIGAEHPDTLATLGNLISTLLEQSRFADALEPARECLRLRTKIAPDDWRRYLAMSQLGLALSGLRRFDEAETNLIGGYRGLVEKSTSIPRSRKSEIRIAAQRVARLYRAWAKSEEAAAWDRTVEAIKSTP